MNTTPTEETEYIRKMYDSQLQSQKDTLTSNYQQALSDIDATKKSADQQLDKNLNTTAVEAQRAQKNYNEVQNAYGLSSGAMAQARLAQDNQLQADLTTLRTAHETADAELERERTLLGQQYAAAISQAQAENDMAKAQALYEEAKERDAQLTAKQQSAAQLMAQVGDFSLYGQAYGLTPDQISALSTQFQTEKQKEVASLMAQVGDFSIFKQIYGLTDDQFAKLQAASMSTEEAASGRSGGNGNTGGTGYEAPNGWTEDTIRKFQMVMGIAADGVWGKDTETKYGANKLTPEEVQAMYEKQFIAPEVARIGAQIMTEGEMGPIGMNRPYYENYVENQIEKYINQISDPAIALEVGIQLCRKYGI